MAPIHTRRNIHVAKLMLPKTPDKASLTVRVRGSASNAKRRKAAMMMFEERKQTRQ